MHASIKDIWCYGTLEERKDRRRFARSLQTSTLTYRSAIAKLCRMKPPVCITSQVFEGLRDYHSCEEIHQIDDLFFDPISRAILYRLAIIAPLLDSERLLAEEESYWKELRATQGRKPPISLNFTAWFSKQHNVPLYPGMPCQPEMNELIHNALNLWLDDVCTRTHTPYLSRKSCSANTLLEAKRLGLVDSDARMISSIDLENIYIETGIKVGGTCEMRQRWYPSNMKPRTYFAQGGHAFFKTRYVKSIMRNLCEFLPSCQKVNRVRPERLVIDVESEDVLVYDMTSFTSSLFPHAGFLYALADFCGDIQINAYDSRVGHHLLSLRDLILDLADMHHNPEFQTKLPDGTSYIGQHKVAGFLGVNGNMQTANFLHTGIMLSVSTPDKLNVAGDDGLIVYRDERHFRDIVACLSMIGTPNPAKWYRLSDGPALCLKKTLVRVGNRLFTFPNIVAPNFLLLGPVTDPRYTADWSKTVNKDKLSASIHGFLTSVYRYSEETYYSYALELARCLYAISGLACNGVVPQFPRSCRGSYFVPAITGYQFETDPISFTIRKHRDIICKVTVTTEMGIIAPGDLNENGDEYVVMDGRKSYEVKLGKYDASKVSFTMIDTDSKCQSLVRMDYFRIGLPLYLITYP